MKQRREDAVSPVVGVMLMLVVTIIIAAVVSGFAGGLASGTDKAPQAAFEAKISESSMGGAYGYEFTLKHLSGDPVDTRYIKLVTSWVNASGAYQVQETIAPRRGAAEDQEYFPGNYTYYLLDSLNTNYTSWGGGHIRFTIMPHTRLFREIPLQMESVKKRLSGLATTSCDPET